MEKIVKEYLVKDGVVFELIERNVNSYTIRILKDEKEVELVDVKGNYDYAMNKLEILADFEINKVEKVTVNNGIEDMIKILPEESVQIPSFMIKNKKKSKDKNKKELYLNNMRADHILLTLDVKISSLEPEYRERINKMFEKHELVELYTNSINDKLDFDRLLFAELLEKEQNAKILKDSTIINKEEKDLNNSFENALDSMLRRNNNEEDQEKESLLDESGIRKQFSNLFPDEIIEEVWSSEGVSRLTMIVTYNEKENSISTFKQIENSDNSIDYLQVNKVVLNENDNLDDKIDEICELVDSEYENEIQKYLLEPNTANENNNNNNNLTSVLLEKEPDFEEIKTKLSEFLEENPELLEDANTASEIISKALNRNIDDDKRILTIGKDKVIVLQIDGLEKPVDDSFLPSVTQVIRNKDYEIFGDKMSLQVVGYGDVNSESYYKVIVTSHTNDKTTELLGDKDIESALELFMTFSNTLDNIVEKGK